MALLGIDASGDYCSAALVEGGVLLADIGAHRPKSQLTWLSGALQDLLGSAGLAWDRVHGVAVTTGPGAYTGLRLALTTARTIAQLLDCPLVGIHTLEALARNAGAAEGLVCPALDARKGEVFAALFQPGEGGWDRVTEDLALLPDALAARLVREAASTGRPVTVLGSALARYGAQLTPAGSVSPLPPPWWAVSARWVAVLGEIALAEGKGRSYHEVPLHYARLPEAEVTRAARQGLVGGPHTS